MTVDRLNDKAVDRIECRPAEPADFDRVAEVWWESGRNADGAVADHPSLAELRARVDREIAAGWELTLAIRAGRIAGFAAIRRGEAILDQLFVLPDDQGGGVGRALLACVQAAMPAGFTLRTAQENTQARRFYERSGLLLAGEGLHPRYGSVVCYYQWEGTTAG